jgi:phytol kinase
LEFQAIAKLLFASGSIVIGLRHFLEQSILAIRWSDLYLLSPLIVVYILASAGLVGWLRMKKQILTSYTRKIFHFMIFTMAAVLQIEVGLRAVLLFGIWTALAVLYAVIRGEGFPFYEALARIKDSPRRTAFILIPLASTALGGVLANLLFPDYAFVGYLVAGWADAVAEPVGARWGRHRYTVPSLFGIGATRSLEGSTAVLMTGVIAGMICGARLCAGWPQMLLLGLTCGLTGCLVEAVSHHGLDNLTIQLAVSAAVFVLLC